VTVIDLFAMSGSGTSSTMLTLYRLSSRITVDSFSAWKMREPCCHDSLRVTSSGKMFVMTGCDWWLARKARGTTLVLQDAAEMAAGRNASDRLVNATIPYLYWVAGLREHRVELLD
jgi:hypothetical protein